MTVASKPRSMLSLLLVTFLIVMFLPLLFAMIWLSQVPAMLCVWRHSLIWCLFSLSSQHLLNLLRSQYPCMTRLHGYSISQCQVDEMKSIWLTRGNEYVTVLCFLLLYYRLDYIITTWDPPEQCFLTQCWVTWSRLITYHWNMTSLCNVLIRCKTRVKCCAHVIGGNGDKADSDVFSVRANTIHVYAEANKQVDMSSCTVIVVCMIVVCVNSCSVTLCVRMWSFLTSCRLFVGGFSLFPESIILMNFSEFCYDLVLIGAIDWLRMLAMPRAHYPVFIWLTIGEQVPDYSDWQTRRGVRQTIAAWNRKDLSILFMCALFIVVSLLFSSPSLMLLIIERLYFVLNV